MSGKPLVLLPRAERDVGDTVEHYYREGGPALAAKWTDAIESALRHIGAHPATGSIRYSAQLKLAGLRFWPVTRFPYLVFYVERADCVDVWRVLHAKRDIPAWLRDRRRDRREPPGRPRSLSVGGRRARSAEIARPAF